MDYEDDILVETEIETDLQLEPEEDVQNLKPSKKEFDNFPKYSNEKLERVYSKYDFSKTFNPKDRKSTSHDFEKFVKDTSDTEIFEESVSIEKKHLKTTESSQKKFNVFKLCGTLVCALLIILSMINLATITDLEKKVETTQKNVNEVELNVGKFIQDVGKLTDEEKLLYDAQNNGMQHITNEIEIPLNEKNVVIEYESKTNFFDEICKFISNIFGG